VSVYSVRGELVRTLLEGVTISAPQALTWDGRNAEGLPVAAGTYFVVVSDGESRTTKKVILQR
jgi:flagellar hook assembly protein FlgD